jgi:hypothetical protein
MGSGGYALINKFNIKEYIMKKILSRENLIAILLCLLIIGLVIITSDDSPLWIYQGF